MTWRHGSACIVHTHDSLAMVPDAAAGMARSCLNMAAMQTLGWH